MAEPSNLDPEQVSAIVCAARAKAERKVRKQVCAAADLPFARALDALRDLRARGLLSPWVERDGTD